MDREQRNRSVKDDPPTQGDREQRSRLVQENPLGDREQRKRSVQENPSLRETENKKDNLPVREIEKRETGQSTRIPHSGR